MSLRGKRIMALDYGDARIGVAICDELQIVVSTRPVILNDDAVWTTIERRIQDDRINMIVVGVPRRHDDTSSPIIERCVQFIMHLRERTGIEVVEMDEAFSTQRARDIMRSSGMSKKRRQLKGVKDQVAAAVILRDFIEEQGT
jgi:putative Holliday junction resolvase